VGMKLLVLVLFCAAMPALYVLLEPRLGRRGASTVTILSMLLGDSGHSGGPLLLDYAHQVMSEIPYLAFSLLALIFVERGLRRPGIRGNPALVAGFLLAMGSYYVRSVGVVLLGAVGAYLLFRRDWRRAFFWTLASGICWLPWALRNRALGSGSAYLQQLVMVNPYYPEQGLLNGHGLIGRLGTNAQAYLTQILPNATWPWSPAPHAWLSFPVLILAGVTVHATYVALRHGRDLLLWLYSAMYLGTLLLWFWQGDRFLVPILPLVLYFAVRMLLDGVRWAGARGYGTVGRGILGLAAGAWILAGLHDTAGLRAFARDGYPPRLRAWSNYQRAGEWLRVHTPPEAVVMCRKGYWLYVVSSRRCVPYPFAPPDSILARIERDHVGYVVVESLGFSQTSRFLIPAINAHRRHFEAVWQRPDPPTYVLRYTRRARAPAPAQ